MFLESLNASRHYRSHPQREGSIKLNREMIRNSGKREQVLHFAESWQEIFTVESRVYFNCGGGGGMVSAVLMPFLPTAFIRFIKRFAVLSHCHFLLFRFLVPTVALMGFQFPNSGLYDSINTWQRHSQIMYLSSNDALKLASVIKVSPKRIQTLSR